MRPTISATMLFAVVVLAPVGTTRTYAAPGEAADPAPDASPGRDRRSIGDAGDLHVRPPRDDAAAAGESEARDPIDTRARETGPTGNDTGTRGADAQDR